ncbi:helix-turn-helix domain-containing protein [Clostridium novyi]|uniref:helix-turn-helix domain-containing protein n=1 Tax=Clostridium novyi TaxID=1542 RepID=UPI0004D6D068|nr:helix-turn-helix domain-containing protein [Clostridium novyi]KEH95244.1 DNA-binding protein [Clostridium novyi A str. GD211209]
MENRVKELPTLLTVKEMASILKIGKNTAYNLIYTKGLPVLRLGPKNIRVPKCILIRWIKKNRRK